MDSYKKYIKSLQEINVPFDDQKMNQKVEERIVRRSFSFNLVLSGALAFLVLVSVIYSYNYSLLAGREDKLASYVYQLEPDNNEPVLDYVYTNGTF